MATGSHVKAVDVSGNPVRVITNVAVDSGAEQQVMTLADDAGNLIPATAIGNKTPLDVNLAGSAGAQSNTSGTLTAAQPTAGTPVAGGTVQAAVGAMGNGTILLAGGTYTALTLVFEASVDSGTNWFPIDATRCDGTGVVLQELFTSAGVRAWNYTSPGYSHVRVRAATRTASVSPTVVITAGPFLIDYSPSIAPIDGNRTTYVATVDGMSTTAATDVFRLTGSASKLIRVTRVDVVCTTGAATNSRVRLIKRQGSYAGGTTSGATIGSLDSSDALATASASGYTAAPTLPSTLQTIVGGAAFFTSAAGTVDKQWTFGNRPSKAVVLRGASEHLAVANSTAIGTSGSWVIAVEFTEE